MMRHRAYQFVTGIVLLSWAGLANAQPQKVGVLRISSTSSLTGKTDSSQEKVGNEILRSFIKEETGLGNEISGQQPWAEVAAKLTTGTIHIGVFQGFEFAWAQEKHPELKPLAVGINVYRYPIVCVFTKKDNPIKDLAGLKGQNVVAPFTGQGCLRLFLDREAEAKGVKADEYFGKIMPADNVEDALDDVVDGKTTAVVIDQASLEAYKRRKPGRFNQLKEVARSQPFPPIVVAYAGSTLDEKSLKLFKDGLVNAAKKEKGEMLLTLSRLSAFELPADDLNPVLAATRKAYPAK